MSSGADDLEVPHLDVFLVLGLSLGLGRLVSLLVVVVDVVGEDLLANLVRTEDRRLAVEDVDLFERESLGLGNEEEARRSAREVSLTVI